MRKHLETAKEIRSSFTGVFERYGTKPNWHGFTDRTVLLTNIKDSAGRVVADHLWFNLTKGFEALGELSPGDILAFDARVKEYVKGYVNPHKGIDDRTVDYKLSHPTKISIIRIDVLVSTI